MKTRKQLHTLHTGSRISSDSRYIFQALEHRLDARLVGRWVRQPALVSMIVVTILTGVFVVEAANTTNNYTGSATGSLLTAGNWNLAHVPNVSEDAVFTATTGVRSLTAGTLTVGSFNVTAGSGTFSIRNNTSTATNSTLTLGGSGNTGNGVSGTAADLLYVAGGSTFNIIGPNGSTGAGVLNIVLGQSGNFHGIGTMTISSAISDGGGGFAITKTGAGGLTLSGANTYTGTTTISAGTLGLGASGVLADVSNMVLNGGTFSTGATTGFTEILSTLALNEHSVISLGTGSHVLAFAASDAVPWTAGKKLVITGWTGGYDGTSGTSGQIFVGSTSAGLTASQLTQISFYDGTNSYAAVILSTGEVVPGPGPTAVKLTKFNAAAFSDGVQLMWESGFEVNNLGYRLHREQNGKRSRVTPSVVAGSALKVGPGNRLTGSSYTWFDPQGTPETLYYLEAIDLNGEREMTGPIAPYAGSHDRTSPRRQRALLLNEIKKQESAAGNGWPAAMSATNVGAANSSLSDHVHQAIAGGKAVKVQVCQSGWYRVTQPELVAAGFDPASDARLLQLFVDGEEVPLRLSAAGARLGANDTLEFYGVALDTPTTDTRTYWLINGTSNGKRIANKRSKPQPGDEDRIDMAGARSFPFTTEQRDKLIYSPRLLNGDASNIFGALIFSDPVDQTLTVRNLDANSTTRPQLEIALQGLTAQNHEVRVSINGAVLGNVPFNASDHATAKFAISRTLLHAGENTVSLSSGNGDSDVSFVDFMRLTYGHLYAADNDALRFSVAGGSVVWIDGFTTPNIRVVDITDPNSPFEVATSGSSSNGAYSVKVQALGNRPRTLMAFADQLASHPAAVFANNPSNWNASLNGADLIVVTHSDFRQQIEPLAAFRRSQGMSVAVVDIEDVYDEFSYGAHTPDALKSFLTTAASTWSRKPAYALLVGDSSWDPRNFMDQGTNDFVPTKLLDSSFMETASDDWLADFTGQGRADMAVGRLPGRSASEISLMVSKIMAYEQERETHAPLRGAVLVADTGFESQSAWTRDLLPANIDTQSIDRSQIGSDDLMRGQVIDALNAGPMIVNFYGHGSVRVWTGAGVLDSDLAGTLTNSNRSSIYLMMTCLNGYAHDAYVDSLSESLLKSQNGGAVAVWASSGYTSPTPQFVMNSEFYRLLFGPQPLRLGQVVREAKLATPDLDVRRTWLLFGDPTMRVR